MTKSRTGKARLTVSMSLALAAATLVGGCSGSMYGDGPQSASYRQYDYNRPDPAYGGYYADRYYRDDARYRERRLSRNDRVYRGQNGQSISHAGEQGSVLQEQTPSYSFRVFPCRSSCGVRR